MGYKITEIKEETYFKYLPQKNLKKKLLIKS